MKKNRLFIYLVLLGIPFLASAQVVYDANGKPLFYQDYNGVRPVRQSDLPSQPRPSSQGYYPRPSVTPSPRPSQTSISPTQPPAMGVVGRKPIMYSSIPGDGGPSCPVCDQMWADFERDHPGKNPRDYFDIRNDASRFRPSIEGGPVGKGGVAAALAGAVAAGPVRTEPIPQGRQPVDLKIEVRRDKNGKPYNYYYLEGAFDKGSLPPNYSLRDPATGKIYSLPEIATLVAEGKLVFTVTYDPKTGEFATTHYRFQSPPSDGSKIVPNPMDIPAVDDDPMFDPPPKKAPASMTAGEADKKIEGLRKLLEQIQKDDAEKAKAGAASGSR